MKKKAALFLAFSAVTLLWLYTYKLNVALDAMISRIETRFDAIESRLDDVELNSEKLLTAVENYIANKQITSTEEVATNVYEYILENEFRSDVEQDYAAFRSKEMNDIFLFSDKAIEAGNTSIGLSSQELTTLQDYMTQTALPYNYAAEDFVDKDYRESTALYVLPYKVQYVYKDADDIEHSILIDYDNNIFLSNAKGRVKVEFDLVRTTTLSTVYRLLNDPRIRFHSSNVSFHEGNEKCRELPDRCSTKYPELDDLAERIYAFGDGPRVYPSIDDGIIIRVSAEELIALYNFMQDTPSMNNSSSIMNGRYDGGWLNISDYYLYTSSNDDILFVGIEYSDGNANLYLSNKFGTKPLPYFKVVLDNSSKSCQDKVLDTIDLSVRPPEKPYYASYADVDISWRPEETESINSTELLVNTMESFVRNNDLLVTHRQNYASYASSDMYRIWDKLHTQALEHPERDEIKLCSEDLITLQHYMTEVALPESASVPDEPNVSIEEITDLCIDYLYDDGHTAKFRIGIWYEEKLYLSLDGNSMIYVTT